MASPKSQFLRNEDDVKAALIMVKSDIFEKLMNAARAEFSCRNPTAEQGRGVTVFERVLRNLPEDEGEDTTWEEVTTGALLDHAIDIPIKHQEPTNK